MKTRAKKNRAKRYIDVSIVVLDGYTFTIRERLCKRGWDNPHTHWTIAGNGGVVWLECGLSKREAIRDAAAFVNAVLNGHDYCEPQDFIDIAGFRYTLDIREADNDHFGWAAITRGGVIIIHIRKGTRMGRYFGGVVIQSNKALEEIRKGALAEYGREGLPDWDCEHWQKDFEAAAAKLNAIGGGV